MTLEERARFLQWLIVDNGYRDPRPIDDERYACIQPKMFTHSIAIGSIGDLYGIDDFWCYRTYYDAFLALEQWDGKGEPAGWFRHTPSGRRIAFEDGEMDEHGRIVPIGQLYIRG